MTKYMFVIPTLANGGAERVVAVLSNTLVTHDREVYVVKYYETEDEYSLNSTVQTINLSGGTRKQYDVMSYFEKIKRLRCIIKRVNPDFVIPFMYSVAQCTDFATLGLDINVIQSIRINPALGPESRLKRILRDHLVYKSNCSFVQNESQREYFKESARRRIHVLYNPVSAELFDVNPKFINPCYTIISVGRLEKQKNFKLLIDSFDEAFSEDFDAILQIYGEGSQKNELQAYISSKKSGNRITLMGRSNDMARVYERGDLFVLSSDYEGMPNALIEAMACGLPCVSTNCPTGPKDLIEDGKNGRLVPVGNVHALAEALLNMKTNRGKAVQMGNAARESISMKCKADNIVQKMIQICESI